MDRQAITKALESCIRDIPDFPSPGIVFKDITPILKDPDLCDAITDVFYEHAVPKEIDVVAGIESRGFFFGIMLANRLRVPFIPIRKEGKLPYRTIAQEYALEYGKACIEIHEDAFSAGANVLIHDDLLATGGTVQAASALVRQLGGQIAGYTFVVELGFLEGRKKLSLDDTDLLSLVRY